MERAQPLAIAPTAALKPWLTLQAECLLAGYRADLVEGDDGRPLFVISRWAMTRSFTDLAAAQTWLSRVTDGQS